MGDSLNSLAYLVNLMSFGICNICSKYHGNDACPANFRCETQFSGDLQGKFYWEQNLYSEEESIWSYQQFQQSQEFDWSRYNELNHDYVADQYELLEVNPHSELKEVIKQMAESDLQFQHVESSLQVLKSQVEQLVSTFHQFQDNKMLHADVQSVEQLQVIPCDASLDENPGEPIKTLFVSSDEHELSNKKLSECMKEIIPKNSLKFDLDEFYTALKIDKSLEIVACECGFCDSCLEISAVILGEDILAFSTTCSKIQANLIVVEFEPKNVDFIHEQPLSIAKILLVEPLIKTHNMQLSFNNCLSYVKDIPPKPPYLLLMSKFSYYLLLPISYLHIEERPPPKPPDMEAAMQP